MCGRFTFTRQDLDEIARLLEIEIDPSASARHRPRYNVAPSDEHWIVAEVSGRRLLLPARWGFGRPKLPLARSESVARNGLFKRAWAARRCLIPTDGFYEWSGPKGARRAHWFHPRSGDTDPGGLLLLAGIYGEGPDGFDFAILTTAANDVVKPVHDRMPVVIRAADAARFLQGTEEEAGPLLAPAQDDLLDARAVGPRVNVAANDDPACLAPLDGDDQAKLFP
jgi:putative SOS response-associated peptidase YedK